MYSGVIDYDAFDQDKAKETCLKEALRGNDFIWESKHWSTEHELFEFHHLFENNVFFTVTALVIQNSISAHSFIDV